MTQAVFPITAVEHAGALQAQASTQLLVTFQKPNPCYEFVEFTTTWQDNTLLLAVKLRDTGGMCMQVITPETQTLTLTFPTAGQYQLQYSGEEGTVVRSLQVQ